MYVIGIAGHLIPASRSWFVYLAPGALIFTACMMLYNDIISENRKLAFWCFITFCFTFIIEAIGVSTGMIFGPYTYGTVLGPKIAGAPPVIALTWVTVILGSLAIARQLSSSKLLITVIAAILCTAFDFILEPVAVHLGYWKWNGAIPLQNYAAWGITALICSAWFQFLQCKAEQKIIGIIFAMQAAYIGIMRVLLFVI